MVAALLSCATTASSDESPAPPPSGDHLWFRSIYKCQSSEYHCGEVDAAPRMPPDIFHNANGRGPIGLYVDYVVDRLWDSGASNCPAVHLETGRCADKGYTKVPPPGARWEWSNWAPEGLMGELCQRACKCNYLNLNKTVLCSAPPCVPPQLPECQDTVDKPTSGLYCSLCGPKFNKPIHIDMFDCKLGGKNECPGPDARPNPAPTHRAVGVFSRHRRRADTGAHARCHMMERLCRGGCVDTRCGEGSGENPEPRRGRCKRDLKHPMYNILSRWLSVRWRRQRRKKAEMNTHEGM